jgi:hypothetical protein
MWLTSDGTPMVIHIWDASDDMPVRRDTTADEEGGRGLLLVDALAKDWERTGSQAARSYGP